MSNTIYVSDAEKIGDSVLVEAINRLLVGLNEAKENYLRTNVPGLEGKNYDNFHVKKVGTKFIYLDAGGSGVFLIERATGELFNIKAYGVPDYNKKKKADIGNVATVDATWLYSKRWNYLR